MSTPLHITKFVENQIDREKNLLAKRIISQAEPNSLVDRIGLTYSFIGDGFYDKSVITLTSAKALTDAPAFVKTYLSSLQKSVPDNFYTTTDGEDVLINALCVHGKKLGLAHTNKENIAITAGAVNAFYSLCYALCDQGDVILTLSPSYILFANAARTFGAEMVLVPSRRKEKFSVDPVDLEQKIIEVLNSGKKIKAVFVVNPTNIDAQCWTDKEIDALAPVLSKYHLTVIEDRVYDGLQYARPDEAAFFTDHPALCQQTITIDSVSKRYGATQWRIGWLYGPEHIVQATKGCIMQTVWSPNSKYQTATALMILAGMSAQERAECPSSPAMDALVKIAEKNETAHTSYFKKLHGDYLSRRDLCLLLISGTEEYKKRAKLTDAKKLYKKYQENLSSYPELDQGICGFSAPIVPQTGMFMLIEADQYFFDKLSRFGPADLILARLLYKEAGVMMLPPTELTLPEGTRMFRMEFGIKVEDLVCALSRLHHFSVMFMEKTEQEIEILVMKHTGHLLNQQIPEIQEIKKIAA